MNIQQQVKFVLRKKKYTTRASNTRINHRGKSQVKKQTNKTATPKVKVTSDASSVQNGTKNKRVHVLTFRLLDEGVFSVDFFRNFFVLFGTVVRVSVVGSLTLASPTGALPSPVFNAFVDFFANGGLCAVRTDFRGFVDESDPLDPSLSVRDFGDEIAGFNFGLGFVFDALDVARFELDAPCSPACFFGPPSTKMRFLGGSGCYENGFFKQQRISNERRKQGKEQNYIWTYANRLTTEKGGRATNSPTIGSGEGYQRPVQPQQIH
jgi:hypothetical protein